MKEWKTLSRREFTVSSALAILNGVVITVSGCGDSGSPSPAPTSPAMPSGTTTTGDVMGAISANHGHIARITAAQLTEGKNLTIDISGNAGHPHTVELSAADLQQIKNGGRVSKASSTLKPSSILYPEVAEHNHTVTFN